MGAIWLGGLGLLTLAAQLALVLTSPWSGQSTLFLALCASTAAISATTALLARQLPSGRLAASWILIVSLAAHLFWIFTTPTLSDDVYRYAFEGKLLRAGLSPYSQPPADESLSGYRDTAIWPRIGHPELSTIYPPASLLAFAAGDALGGVRGEKLLFGGMSVLVTAVLLALLRRRERPVALAAAYAWAPLPALEFAGSGHHDSLGILLLVLAFAGLEWRKTSLSGIGWALSVAVKALPVVTLPAFWRSWTWTARTLAVVLAMLSLTPLFLLSRSPHSGLWAYAGRWQHNDIVYTGVTKLIGDGGLSRMLVLIALGVLALLLGRFRWSPERTALYILVAALILSPTFHPWYAGWVLMLSALVPSAGAWALGQTVLITYAVPGIQSDPGFAPVPMIWRVLVWLIPALLFANEYRRRRSESRREREIPSSPES